MANAVIYVCAITVGVMSYYMADRKHRKAFLEARQSLEVKLNLEEQSQQQVPQHPSGCCNGAAETPPPSPRCRMVCFRLHDAKAVLSSAPLTMFNFISTHRRVVLSLSGEGGGGA